MEEHKKLGCRSLYRKIKKQGNVANITKKIKKSRRILSRGNANSGYPWGEHGTFKAQRLTHVHSGDEEDRADDRYTGQRKDKGHKVKEKKAVGPGNGKKEQKNESWGTKAKEEARTNEKASPSRGGSCRQQFQN